MMSKLHREHDALDRGASRKIRAIKAAFLPGSDVNCIIVTRSEIEAYALARVKQHSQGGPRASTDLFRGSETED